jgi:carbon storage regulator
MLLITRRPGEAIMINGTIAVKVVDIRGGRVKLGFEFPPGNTVYREELFTKIQAENRAAQLGSALPGAGGPPVSGTPLADVIKNIPAHVHKKETTDAAPTDNQDEGAGDDDEH